MKRIRFLNDMMSYGPFLMRVIAVQCVGSARCRGDNSEPRRFILWAPKAIGLIGVLPDTLETVVHRGYNAAKAALKKN
jgi:hypothetical protein